MSKKTKFRRISHQNRLNGGGGVGFLIQRVQVWEKSKFCYRPPLPPSIWHSRVWVNHYIIAHNRNGGLEQYNIESNPLALLIVCTISGNKSFVAHYVDHSKKSLSKVHLNMFYWSQLRSSWSPHVSNSSGILLRDMGLFVLQRKHLEGRWLVKSRKFDWVTFSI